MAAKGNVPSLPGAPKSGGRGKGTVPNGQYPTVHGTRATPANVPGNLGALTRGRGSSTVNSTPTK